MDEDTIRMIKETVEIPVVYTVVSEKVDLERKLATGLDFINVSGADRTPFIVSELRRRYPGAAHHRHRRPDGGHHPRHHSGRGERHHIQPAQQRPALRQGYAPLPPVVRGKRRRG